MEKNEFEAQLKADGFTQIESKSVMPRPANEEHGHDYDVRGLVLAGAFIVIQNDKWTTYQPGDVFTVAAGLAHAEAVGPDGAQILVGRKY